MADSGAQQQQHTTGSHGEGPPALAVPALLALASGLAVLSGTALAASVVGLAVATPLFVLFSPVLVPGALMAALIGTGMAATGALALGALALLSPLVKAARKAAASPPDYVAEGKRRVAEVVGPTTAHVEAGQAMKTVERGPPSRWPYVPQHRP
ncbi:oleosin Zm-II-like [Brachypodium distachyon]|nr:oleosin Zm-II-like [Brachypodium distachyon]|eukprot:XP_010236954.1 oleosin Zm-II-like [Brachypodium distachyon]